MPDNPRPPAQKPTVGSGKKYGGISRTWWIVGGVATVGIIYYSVHKRKAAAVDPNAVDPSLATDGGSSGIPSDAGATGITPSGISPSDPFSNIPSGSTLTFTAPDGSTTTVQEPSATVPTGSTTAGGSSGGVDSGGGTTTVNTDTTTPAVTPAPVIAPPPVTVNPALAWQNTAESWFAAHHYDARTVRTALTKYQLGEGLDQKHLGVVETAIKHFGALVGTPAVKVLPVHSEHPKPKPKHTGRQKAHH